MKFGVSAALAGLAFGAQLSAQTMLDEVVVSASRSEQSAFDAPGSIDLVDRQEVERGGPQVNISEALGLVPGINVANRNNFAQDLQISIRGFGSRAPFGVRGVRLMVDGLPLTLPDGQGQTSQFSATSTDRIEVLKGPLSALYGNAGGGLIQAFTRDPSFSPELQINGFAGSDDLYRSSVQYSETRGNYGLLVDYGALTSQGFREYSAAERHHLNAKLVVKQDSGKTTFIANTLNQVKGEDPGSRTLANFQSAPYAADTSNLQYKAGKKFLQSLVGLVNERSLGSDAVLTSRVYAATRDLDNPGRSSATWFLIDRVQYGAAVDYRTAFKIADTSGQLTVGVEADQVQDARVQRTNTNGVMGSSNTRDEDNIAVNYGASIRADWYLSGSYTLTTGLRLTSVQLQVKDHYFTDSIDGSGSRTYTGVSPVIGVVRHIDPSLNLYANVAQSFETPTLNEVLYTPGSSTSSSNRFYGLDPAKSDQAELGFKWKSSQQSMLTGSLFLAKTEKDIVPLWVTTTGATWQNANTQRKGAELAGSTGLDKNFSLHSALSIVQGTYRQSLTIYGSGTYGSSVASGSRLTNIPNDRVQVELRYRSTEMATKDAPFFQAGVELSSVGKIYVKSDNSASTSRYQLINLSLTANRPMERGLLTVFARVDNLTDKLYAASIIGDQEAGRYYEPGAPRNYLLGLKYTLTM